MELEKMSIVELKAYLFDANNQIASIQQQGQQMIQQISEQAKPYLERLSLLIKEEAESPKERVVEEVAKMSEVGA